MCYHRSGKTCHDVIQIIVYVSFNLQCHLCKVQFTKKLYTTYIVFFRCELFLSVGFLLSCQQTDYLPLPVISHYVFDQFVSAYSLRGCGFIYTCEIVLGQVVRTLYLHNYILKLDRAEYRLRNKGTLRYFTPNNVMFASLSCERIIFEQPFQRCYAHLKEKHLVFCELM